MTHESRTKGTIEAGRHPPNDKLPPQVRTHPANIAEVVEATGTQVLEMRERGGPGADRFTLGARQGYGTFMVAFGDIEGTRLRELAWTPDGTR